MSMTYFFLLHQQQQSLDLPLDKLARDFNRQRGLFIGVWKNRQKHSLRVLFERSYYSSGYGILVRYSYKNFTDLAQRCGPKTVKFLCKSDKPFPGNRRRKLAKKMDRKKGTFFGATLYYQYVSPW